MRTLPTIILSLVTLYSTGQNPSERTSVGRELVTKQLQTFNLKQREKKDVYEIPSNFRGLVTIFKDETCGQKIKQKKGVKIIQIPTDGILIIKDDKLDFSYDVNDGDLHYRYSPNIYYQVNSKNKRTELPELVKDKFDNETENKYSKDQIGVFHQGFGSGQTFVPDTVSYSYYELYIGTYNDLVSDNYQTEIIKKGKESVDKLRKCRRR